MLIWIIYNTKPTPVCQDIGEIFENRNPPALHSKPGHQPANINVYSDAIELLPVLEMGSNSANPPPLPPRYPNNKIMIPNQHFPVELPLHYFPDVQLYPPCCTHPPKIQCAHQPCTLFKHACFYHTLHTVCTELSLQSRYHIPLLERRKLRVINNLPIRAGGMVGKTFQYVYINNIRSVSTIVSQGSAHSWVNIHVPHFKASI